MCGIIVQGGRVCVGLSCREGGGRVCVRMSHCTLVMQGAPSGHAPSGTHRPEEPLVLTAACTHASVKSPSRPPLTLSDSAVLGSIILRTSFSRSAMMT